MTRNVGELTLDRASADALAADTDFWELYESAFPRAEREPPSVIIESVRGGAGLAIRARADGVTVGLATTHLLRDPAATFLVYLAISKQQRNQGLGPRLVAEAVRAAPPALVWEVDPPGSARSPEARLLRERRIQFFQRLGGEILLPTYLQPPVNGGGPVPMILMGRNFASTPPTLEALVRAMYFQKYGSANGIDPALLERLVHATIDGHV